MGVFKKRNAVVSGKYCSGISLFKALSLSMALLTTSTGLTGCQKQAVTYSELMAYWTNDTNELCQQQHSGAVKVTICYKPTDLVAVQHYRRELQQAMDFDSLRSALNRYIYFTMDLSRHGRDIESNFAAYPAQYSKVISYLSYGARELIKLQCNGQTLPVADYAYARHYDMLGATKLLFAFDRCQVTDQDQFTVVFNDNLLGFGSQKFKFSTSVIDTIPDLDPTTL